MKNKNKMNYSVCSLSHLIIFVLSSSPTPLVTKTQCFVSSHTPGGAVTFSHCHRRRKLSLFVSPDHQWLYYLCRRTVSVIDYVEGELYLIVDSSIHGCWWLTFRFFLWFEVCFQKLVNTWVKLRNWNTSLVL